ncbi:MAG: AMP-binding protein [Candidatus Binatia bacterium]|nr:AMP-binding protein [Candidatus Binatia bacterium]
MRASDPALLSAARVLSYGDLARAVEHGGREIDERFAPGSRILIAGYDQMVVALALLSALQSQCVPLLVDPQSATELARVAGRWDVAGGVGDPKILGALDAVIDDTAVLGWTTAAGPGGAELEPVHAGDPAFWTFTSGTTGEPRAVVHAHRGPRAAYEAFGRDVLSLAPTDRTASTAGLPFVYALGNNLFFPLLAGGSAILPADLLLPTVLAEVRRHDATVLVSGPWSLEAMARLADRSDRGEALRRLRLVLSAGEPLAASVFSRWQSAFGQTPLDNLGCTEMFNSFLSPRPEGALPGSLGHVVPGFEVRLGGQPPAAGRRGALTVRGESRAVAMSCDDGNDQIVETDGEWCETGDELEVDETGRFTYLGRLDDRFKVRGQFVRPAEVERRLRTLDGIRECLVSSETDDHGLACVSVRLVLGADYDAAEVLRAAGVAARQVLPAAARTLRLERVEALPRSPRGKVLRERRAASS